MNIFYLRAMLKLIRNVGHGNHAPSADIDAAGERTLF
jgi:hypothetical protein